MDNIILLILCIVSGLLLRRIPAFPANGYQALNLFVIYLSLPAVALYYVPKIPLSFFLLFPISLSWLSFILSFIIFGFLGKYLKWSDQLTGCLILTAGLGNTSFVGFPVLEALFGPEALATGVLIDQPGSFLVVSTLGVFTAVLYSQGNIKTGFLLRKVITFPPFIAFILAFTLNFCRWDFPEELQSVFLKIGYTVVPLSLVSVGLQLRFNRKSAYWRFLVAGLSYKLLIFPAFLFVLYYYIFGLEGDLLKICVIEAGMAPMITAAIIASSYKLKPVLGSMMISYGIPVSLITLFLWYMLLSLI